MLSKNQIKFVSSLQQKKFRTLHNAFIAEGHKVVQELLKSNIVVTQLYSTAEYLADFQIDANVDVIEVKKPELERISAFATASDVMVVCEIPHLVFDPQHLKGKLTLVLDDIKDPGNLGTIIRIADWFGIENIVCSLETVDVFNPKTIQATMGSIARVKVHRSDLITFFEKQTIKSFGAVLGGASIYEQVLPKEGLLVIGNESKGISESILPLLSQQISIPSYANTTHNENAESLNAAIATAIICGEFKRQNA
jgi:RNA methyltransferase, TrmH family